MPFQGRPSPCCRRRSSSLAARAGMRDRENSPPRITTSRGTVKGPRRSSGSSPQFTSRNSISGRARASDSRDESSFFMVFSFG